MKAKIKFWLFAAMTYLALLTAVKTTQFVTTNAMEFSPLFREKYMSMLTVVLIHGVTAITALVLGPILFSKAIRSKAKKVHRVLGRVYALCIYGGAVTGFYMGLQAYGGTFAQVGFCLLSVLWIVTVTKAIRAAISRDLVNHRKWMMRNYALTFAAVTLRLYLSGLSLLGIEFEAAYPFVAWLAWAPNLLVAEFILRKPRMDLKLLVNFKTQPVR